MRKRQDLKLTYDPIPHLLQCDYPNIQYFARRDLLNEKVESIHSLWTLKGAEKIIRKQQSDGSWKYPNPNPSIRDPKMYNLYATYGQLGSLIEKFGFDKSHPTIQKAMRYVEKYQSDEGDIRGIYWDQYSPNYTAGFLELLTKAGYWESPMVKKGLEWLLKIRQDDGGWAIPIRTHGQNISNWQKKKKPVEPDRSKPFSYMVTGVVLRAFAYNPEYKTNIQIHHAADLVLSRLFQRDMYPDRNTLRYWTSFTFPFQYTDLAAVLDPMANLGFTTEDKRIMKGLHWFTNHQSKNGGWKVHILKGDKQESAYWVDLSIARLFKKYGINKF